MGLMEATGEMYNPLCAKRNGSVEEVTPGLSSEEVRPVEECDLDEGRGILPRLEWQLAHNTIQQPEGKGHGEGSPQPTAQGRRRPGHRSESKGAVYLPLPDGSLQAFPHHLLPLTSHCLSWLPGSF